MGLGFTTPWNEEAKGKREERARTLEGGEWLASRAAEGGDEYPNHNPHDASDGMEVDYPRGGSRAMPGDTGAGTRASLVREWGPLGVFAPTEETVGEPLQRGAEAIAVLRPIGAMEASPRTNGPRQTTDAGGRETEPGRARLAPIAQA